MITPSLSTAFSQAQPSYIFVVKELSSSKYPVYLASNIETNQQMALKSFPLDDRRYDKEKAILVKLSHPHIIGLLEVLENTNLIHGEKRSYLGLEYAPYGDMLDIIANNGKIPEVLTRTIFHHLVDALSYMHEQDIAHMDLKLDNLLLGENFAIKVSDFDLSQRTNSFKLESRGTPGCRAPEVKKGICEDLKAADIYSAAIILFTMVSGNPPYGEISRGYELEFDGYYKVMRKHNSRFWDAHSKHRKDPHFYSPEFKELFSRMIEEDPVKRATIKEIIDSAWFRGPVLNEEGYKAEMINYMKK